MHNSCSIIIVDIFKLHFSIFHFFLFYSTVLFESSKKLDRFLQRLPRRLICDPLLRFLFMFLLNWSGEDERAKVAWLKFVTHSY